MNTSKYIEHPTPEADQSPYSNHQDQHKEELHNPNQQPGRQPGRQKEHQNKKQQSKNRDNKPQVNDSAPDYRLSLPDELPERDEPPESDESTQAGVEGLSASQQQFVLKFCRQLASVIEACERSDCAEIEIGRRQINTKQIKVKLQAERELTLDANSQGNNQGNNRH